MASRLQPGAPFGGSFFSTFGKSAKGSVWGEGPFMPAMANSPGQWPTNMTKGTAGSSEAPGSPKESRSRSSSWIFEGTGSFWVDPFESNKKAFPTPVHNEPSLPFVETSNVPVNESGPQSSDPVRVQGAEANLPKIDEISDNELVEGGFLTPGAAQATHEAESTMLAKLSAGTYGTQTSPPPEAGTGSPLRNRAHFHGDGGSFFQDHWQRGNYGGDTGYTGHAGTAERGHGGGEGYTGQGTGEHFGFNWRGGGFGGIGFGNQFETNDPTRPSVCEPSSYHDSHGNRWTDSRESLGAMLVGDSMSLRHLETTGVSGPAALEAVDAELMTTGAARINLRFHGNDGTGRPTEVPGVHVNENVSFDFDGASAFNMDPVETDEYGRGEDFSMESVAGQWGGAAPEAVPSNDFFDQRSASPDEHDTYSLYGGVPSSISSTDFKREDVPCDGVENDADWLSAAAAAATAAATSAAAPDTTHRPFERRNTPDLWYEPTTAVPRSPSTVEPQGVVGLEHELQHEELPSVRLGHAGVASFVQERTFRWDDPPSPSGLVEGRAFEAFDSEYACESEGDGGDDDLAAFEAEPVDDVGWAANDAPLAASTSSRFPAVTTVEESRDPEPCALLPAWMQVQQWMDTDEDTVTHKAEASAADIPMDLELGMHLDFSSADSAELPSAEGVHSNPESSGAVFDVERGIGDGSKTGRFPMSTAQSSPDFKASGTPMSTKGNGSDTGESGVTPGRGASDEAAAGDTPPGLTIQAATEASRQPAFREDIHIAQESPVEASRGASRPAVVLGLVIEGEALAPMEDSQGQAEGVLPGREVGRNGAISVPVPLLDDANTTDGGWLAGVNHFLVETLERAKGFFGVVAANLREAFSCVTEERRSRGAPETR